MNKMPELADVFEQIGEGVPFSQLSNDTLFMIEDTAINYYWRTQHHGWRPYQSSIVFRKKSEASVQRLMTALPVPPEQVTDTSIICWSVRLLAS